MTDAWKAVMAEMEARRELGLERYGKPAAPHDGEDYGRHLFEELLDALPYLTAWRQEFADLKAERDKLQRFKDYVHARLDAANVPADPDSPHKAEGCRIGGRLDWVCGRLGADPSSSGEATFQGRVLPWLLACFGADIAGDRAERSHRFLEEALELVQAGGVCTAADAHRLVDYVYGRPAGELRQEVGGVMTTLAAFCLAHNLDMHESAESELARVWTKVEQIRAKQAAKPKGSPLPVPET